MKAFVYILTNRYNKVLYTGVTSDLASRIKKHKERANHKSFTSKYNVDKLVYFETLDSIGVAIKREKQIKAGSRKKKLELILSTNPDWRDLFIDIANGL